MRSIEIIILQSLENIIKKLMWSSQFMEFIILCVDLKKQKMGRKLGFQNF